MNNEPLASLQPVESASPDSRIGETVGRIAWLLAQSHYPGGDRAALKRWAPGQPLPLAYYRLWLQCLRTDLPPDAQAASWMAIIWGLALGGGDAHRPQRQLGQALAESRFAEARLERLLSAPESLRADFYQSAVRFLSSKGEACNWAEWARYLLTQQSEVREGLHRRIAQAYYRYLPRQSD